MQVVYAQFDASPSVATHMPILFVEVNDIYHFLFFFKPILMLIGALDNLSEIVTVLNRNTSLVLAEANPEEESQVARGNLLAYTLFRLTTLD
jgi:hypothetical protein